MSPDYKFWVILQHECLEELLLNEELDAGMKRKLKSEVDFVTELYDSCWWGHTRRRSRKVVS